MPTLKTPYIARKFVAASPDVQILGGVLLGLLQATEIENIDSLLQSYGLAEIAADKWYPQQLVLDFYKAVASARFNSSQNLTEIGTKMVDSTPIQPAENSIKGAIEALDVLTKHVMRNAPEEEKFLIPVSRPGYLLVISNQPYPDDVLYGYLWSLSKRFSPPGSQFTLKYVNNPDPAKHPGTAYEITWK